MEEIASQFREELQELIDRYKTRLSVPRIMCIAQDVLHKTLSIKYHPELHAKEIIKELLNSCFGYNSKTVNYEAKAKAEQFLRDMDYTRPRPGSEPNAFRGPNAICSQGSDGCCATYKDGWDKCKGCVMYHGENRCID